MTGRGESPEKSVEWPPFLLLEFVARNLRTLAFSSLIGGLFLGGVAFFKARTFTSTALLTPDVQAEGGQLAGLAAQFGVGLPGGAGAIPPALFVMLLRSDVLLDGVVSAKLPPLGDSAYVDRLPKPLMVKLGIVDETREAAVRRAARFLRNRMGTSADVETGTVRVQFSDEDRAVARALVSKALDVLDSLGTEARRRQGRFQREFYEERLRQASDSLRVAAGRVAAFLARNRTIQGSPYLQFQYEQLQREVVGDQALYQSLRQGYEQARLEAARSVPSIVVLEMPSLPVRPDARGAVLSVLLGVLLGLMVSTVGLYAKNSWRQVSETRPERAEAVRAQFLRLLAWYPGRK